jgi:hypothetical protein
MKEEPFPDYYEVLQLSPNAHSETIESVFRILAKRYHPDNKVTGTAEKFNVLTIELERILGCPEKHMEFHIWYLREKRWIERMDSGGFAITADGVDAAREQDFLLMKDRLLEENNPLGNDGVPARSRLNEGDVSAGLRRNSGMGG